MPPSLPTANEAPVTAAATQRRKRRRANETTPAREGELLRVAAGIFRTKGYDPTSLSDIAHAFGITKASLYHYIDSKEDLLYRICRAAHDDALPVIEAVESSDAPPLVRLEHFLRATVASNARNVVNIAVYYHDFNRLTGARRTSILRERRRYQDLLSDLSTKGSGRARSTRRSDLGDLREPPRAGDLALHLVPRGPGPVARRARPRPSPTSL